MKSRRNTFLKTMRNMIVVFAMTCMTNLNALQGPGGPPVGGTNTVDNAGDAIPLDGGLIALVIGAAAFGVKKLRGNKKGEV